MPLFKFKVANDAGKIEEILIESESESEATRRVRSRSLIPIEFLGHGDSRGGRRAWGLRRKFDVADFSDRLVPLLQADIPLERALGIIEETSESQEEKELVVGLRRGLHEGRKLSQLIRDRGRQFPRMYASIVEAGEEAGALPQVLAQLPLRRFPEAHHIDKIDTDIANGRTDFPAAIQQSLSPEFGEGRRSFEYVGHKVGGEG